MNNEVHQRSGGWGPFPSTAGVKTVRHLREPLQKTCDNLRRVGGDLNIRSACGYHTKHRGVKEQKTQPNCLHWLYLPLFFLGEIEVC
jgi:hypothetical protein